MEGLRKKKKELMDKDNSEATVGGGRGEGSRRGQDGNGKNTIKIKLKMEGFYRQKGQEKQISDKCIVSGKVTFLWVKDSDLSIRLPHLCGSGDCRLSG